MYFYSMKHLNALERLLDGYVAAEEVVQFVNALSTRTEDEFRDKTAKWSQTAQGKRFNAGKDALPTEANIHYDIGYLLRKLSCDVALAHFHKERKVLRTSAESAAEDSAPTMKFSLQIGIDRYDVIWDKTKRRFVAMELVEPVSQEGGFEYMMTTRIAIPAELG